METETVETNGVKAPKVKAEAPKKEAPKKESKLKGKDPKQAEPTKPKILIFGKSGVGKTFTAIDFPNVYYIDTEGGATRGHYTDKLKRSGGVYFGVEDGSLDPSTVLEQIQALATEEHGNKTLVIDSITKVFNRIVAEEAEKLGDKDVYGASKKPAIAWMRRLINWIGRLDMNVILIAHEKDLWGSKDAGKIGETFDAWDKLEYELDLSFQIQKQGSSRYALIRKSRLSEFEEGTRFPWSYAEFSSRYGKDVIESESKAITLADEEQLHTIRSLLDVMRVSEDEIAKWFARAGVESFEEMSTETIEKCISFLKSKIGAGK